MQPLEIAECVGVVYWIVSVAAGMYVSAEKGRSPGEGMFFGLIFGPLGVLIAAVMPTLEKKQGPAAAAGTCKEDPRLLVRQQTR